MYSLFVIVLVENSKISNDYEIVLGITNVLSTYDIYSLTCKT